MVRGQHGSRPAHGVLKGLLTFVVVLLLVLAALVGGGYAYLSAQVNRSRISAPTDAVSLSAGKPFTVMIVGTTTTDSGSKSLVKLDVASVNPVTGRTVFANLPTTASLPAGDGPRLATTYNLKGLPGLLAQVKRLLKLPVNRVVSLDMAVLADFAVATGGVVVSNATAFRSSGYQFMPGSLKLTTVDQVTAYLGLLGPQDEGNLINRQSAVSAAVFANLGSRSILRRLPGVMDTYCTEVKSDFSLADFAQLGLHYRSALHSLDKVNFHVSTDEHGAERLTQAEIDSDAAAFMKSLSERGLS